MALSGSKVLITRPMPWADTLSRLVAVQGGIPFCVPMLVLEKTKKEAEFLSSVELLKTFDMAVFVSRSAVDYTMPLVKKHYKKLPAITWVAMGPGTAFELSRYGVQDPIVPQAPYTSEQLLTHPSLQQVLGKHIVVFRGDKGRTLLTDTLHARGAKVYPVEAYHCLLPTRGIEALRTRFKNNKIDIVVITSEQSLNNLLTVTGDALKEKVLSHPLVVVSTRLAQVAQTLGFSKVVTAKSAEDSAVLKALVQWQAVHPLEVTDGRR